MPFFFCLEKTTESAARSHISKLPQLPHPKKKPSSLSWAFIYQCSFSRGSVPRPILLPSIIIAVRKNPYSAIWCMRYSDT